MKRLLLILAAPMMFLITTAAVCDGQYPLDSTRDVVMALDFERSTDVCLNYYHGSPQVINDVFICKAVKDYPVYGITPGFPN